MTEDQGDTAAAELALGLLDGPQRASALRRVLAEPAFAAEVKRWTAEFGHFFPEVRDIAPDPVLLGRIERRLDRGVAGSDGGSRRWLWPSLAGLSTTAAVALLSLLLTRPVTVAPAPAPTTIVFMSAVIQPTGAGAPIVAVYAPTIGQIRVAPAGLADRRHSAQLWIIGRDGVPRSVGLLLRNAPTALLVTPAIREQLAADAVLAVSAEPIGGSPKASPTGPVVAQGKLTQS